MRTNNAYNDCAHYLLAVCPLLCWRLQVHCPGFGHGAVAAVSHTYLQSLQAVRVRTPQRNSSCIGVRCMVLLQQSGGQRDCQQQLHTSRSDL
jgi:hypothetical protein